LYELKWDEEAKAELGSLRAFDRRIILATIEQQLQHEAEVETTNRKTLLEPLEDLPEATWELRVHGDFRVLYQVTGGQTVTILRVILKATAALAAAVGKRRQS